MVKVEEEVVSTIKLDEITAEIVKAYLTYSKDIAAPLLACELINNPVSDSIMEREGRTMRRRRHLILAVIFIFIGTASLSIFPPEIDAEEPDGSVGDPDICIVMDEYEKSVNVAPGQDGVVEFNGSVRAVFTNTTPEEEVYVVRLVASCDGWSGSLPPAIVLTMEAPEKGFNIKVQAPPKTSTTEKGLLVIQGNWVNRTHDRMGNIDPVDCTINILPFVSIRLGCDAPYQETDIGEWAVFWMRLSNDGNYDAIVDIQMVIYMDRLEVEPKNITLEVPEGETVTFTVRMRQKEGPSGVGYIDLSAKCDIHSGEEPWTYSLYLRSDPTLSSIHDEVWFYPLAIGLASLLITAAFIGVLIKVILWRTGK